MRGRKGIIEVLTKEKFIEMYTSGMSFDEIGETIGATGICIKDYFLENFLGFERFKLKTKRMKNIDGRDMN